MAETEPLFPGQRPLPRDPSFTRDSRVRYAGFWKRLGAHLLDTIILLPLFGLIYWGGEQSRWFSAYYTPFGLLFGIWFNVYLVKRYGGTPGKRLLSISIKRVDLSPVSDREAWLRYIVMFVLSVVSSIAYTIALTRIGDAEYHSLSFMDRAVRLDALTPSWNGAVTWALNIWIWGEFIVMMMNDERRALHDFMAGTVVVCDDPPPAPVTA